MPYSFIIVYDLLLGKANNPDGGTSSKMISKCLLKKFYENRLSLFTFFPVIYFLCILWL